MTSPALLSEASLTVPDRPRRRFTALTTYGPFAVLLFGPLAFGAVDPWSIFVMEIAAASVFAFWAIDQIRSGQPEILGHPLFPPMMAFGALLAFQLATGRTAYRYATYLDLMLYSTYGLLCFVVAQTLRKTRDARWIAFTLSVYGTLVAIFAVMQSVSSVRKLYWFLVPRSGGWVYGPYVNHNHYAGLMEMLAPIPLVFALGRHVRDPIRKLAITAAAIMIATIFLSGSRGGIVAFTVQMAVLAAVVIKRSKGRGAAWTLGIVLAIVIGILAWLGGGELTRRMASMGDGTRTELSIQLRRQVNHDGVQMFAAKPFLGWGAGTFREVYPRFRSFYATVVVDRAHNDYLQLLIETGLAGAAITLWFLALVYRKAAMKLGDWADDINGTLALASLLGCTGILVHSIVDFNLHIPANAALFYVLCTIAALSPRFGNRRRRAISPTEAETTVGPSSEVILN